MISKLERVKELLEYSEIYFNNMKRCDYVATMHEIEEMCGYNKQALAELKEVMDRLNSEELAEDMAEVINENSGKTGHKWKELVGLANDKRQDFIVAKCWVNRARKQAQAAINIITGKDNDET